MAKEKFAEEILAEIRSQQDATRMQLKGEKESSIAKQCKQIHSDHQQFRLQWNRSPRTLTWQMSTNWIEVGVLVEADNNSQEEKPVQQGSQGKTRYNCVRQIGSIYNHAQQKTNFRPNV